MNVNDPKQIRKCTRKKVCQAPFHQPGGAAGYGGFPPDKPKTCPNMVARLFGDNPILKMSTFEARCPAATSKIALVVDESDDYHFLRQDSSGYWSQKSGARKVTNLDAGDHKIWDPRLCDLDFRKKGGDLNYDIFCGYLCVPRNRPLYMRPAGGGGKRKPHGVTRRR
jgi:hypothetical protein